MFSFPSRHHRPNLTSGGHVEQPRRVEVQGDEECTIWRWEMANPLLCKRGPRGRVRELISELRGGRILLSFARLPELQCVIPAHTRGEGCGYQWKVSWECLICPTLRVPIGLPLDGFAKGCTSLASSYASMLCFLLVSLESDHTHSVSENPPYST